MISRSAEYAIRAMLYLAGANGNWSLNREIARELELPPQFLTKLLAALTREDLLVSQRGKSGGFRLARPAEQITLLEIVEPFDRMKQRRRCLLGRSECSEAQACQLHRMWAPIQDRFRDSFSQTTLADLLESASTPERAAALDAKRSSPTAAAKPVVRRSAKPKTAPRRSAKQQKTAAGIRRKPKS